MAGAVDVSAGEKEGDDIVSRLAAMGTDAPGAIPKVFRLLFDSNRGRSLTVTSTLMTGPCPMPRYLRPDNEEAWVDQDGYLSSVTLELTLGSADDLNRTGHGPARWHGPCRRPAASAGGR